ncbi:DDE transposase [Hypericibacter terrae]|uniref:DDE transposase n=1 Tax=Hypericibacter terrae TaxID=2602015 RepID=A0A5J6MG67_9PROT|nr:IS1595 family transposase [Hypericibacter terrae]QEX16121.1 DDE transposase [Hypericibacter terrae]
MTADLQNPIFQDADKAREFLEATRWPDGPICPHCGALENIRKLEGKAHRPGLFQCNSCEGQFSVTVGTVFERSHIPLHKWLLATHLLCASKKGMSAHQLHRMLGITYKTAWFMAHRIREAMREGHFSGPLGGTGKTVEADETYVGGKEKNKHRNKRTKGNIGGKGKEVVFSLVERGGSVRSHHVPEVNAKTLRPILVAQIDRKSFLMTDEAGQYYHPGKEFAKHETVNHGAGEYVRGEAHSNTVENYFSILKRGITGTYHHVSQQHLKRYLAEFDFRYNERSGLGVSDDERAVKALKGIEGKRLTYRRPDKTDNA